MFDRVSEVLSFDMLYQGQTHTIGVEVAVEDLNPTRVQTAFEATYRREFGRVLDGIPVRMLNLRYSRIGQRPKFDLHLLAPKGEGVTTPIGTQAVYINGQWVNALRFDRMALPVGHRVAGPAILEQIDTTVWLEPGYQAVVDAFGNLILSRL